VAYWAPRPGNGAPAESELRAFLTRRLPEALMPALLVRLGSLPLGVNGKVDRGALPAPPTVRPDLGTAYAVPRSTAERAIADVWRQCLGLERVGVRDNFFDLGGHSLLLLEVQRRLGETFGLEVPVVELFRLPTIESLAASLSRGEEGRRPDRDDRPASRREAAFLLARLRSAPELQEER
jgi:acyl carrier protein